MNRQNLIKIAPSLLAADFGNLQSEIEKVNKSEADWLHLDIMDGVFVPNISFGFPVMDYINRLSTKPLDVHLMIVQPERYIAQVKACGAMMMNVHYEACTHLHRTIQEIHQAEMKAGVTLNPSTPVSVLEEIIEEVDMVLLMSVNPGFGGQQFIPRTIEKVALLKQLINQRQAKALIEVDGGVNPDNAAALIDAGANILVAGSAVFKSPDIDEVIHRLKHPSR